MRSKKTFRRSPPRKIVALLALAAFAFLCDGALFARGGFSGGGFKAPPHSVLPRPAPSRRRNSPPRARALLGARGSPRPLRPRRPRARRHRLAPSGLLAPLRPGTSTIRREARAPSSRAATRPLPPSAAVSVPVTAPASRASPRPDPRGFRTPPSSGEGASISSTTPFSGAMAISIRSSAPGFSTTP